jgi:hypothetical protein
MDAIETERDKQSELTRNKLELSKELEAVERRTRVLEKEIAQIQVC